jgi:2-keto-4-pentenoate hydratase
MDADRARSACDFLYEHWRRQTRTDALPADLRPSTRAEGYAIQAFIERHSRLPVYGWKIAATSDAGQAHIGVDGPLAGRILAERVIEDGGRCALGNNLMRVAELEFAFRMAQDIPQRVAPYTVPEILERVGSLHPAIEIPDSRFDQFERVGLAQLIADNACAHRFVLGPSSPDEWRRVDLATHKVQGFLNDEKAANGVGANVLGDPLVALAWLANELIQHGLALKAGQVVTTGTCVIPMTIAAGDRVRGDFGLLGNVSLSFE